MDASLGRGLWRLMRGDRLVGEHNFVVIAHNGARKQKRPHKPTTHNTQLQPATQQSSKHRTKSPVIAGKCANRLLRPSGAPNVDAQMAAMKLNSVWCLMVAFAEPVGAPFEARLW